MGQHMRAGGENFWTVEVGGATIEANHRLTVDLSETTARLEVHPPAGNGKPTIIDSTNPAVLFILRRAVIEAVRVARRHAKVTPIPKPVSRSRSSASLDPTSPVTCPACLGQSELAPSCVLCDGVGWVTARSATRWEQND